MAAAAPTPPTANLRKVMCYAVCADVRAFEALMVDKEGTSSHHPDVPAARQQSTCAWLPN
jgi:hypothetical protein